MFERTTVQGWLLALPLISLGVGWILSRSGFRRNIEKTLVSLRFVELFAALGIFIQTFGTGDLEVTFFKTTLFNFLNVDFGLRGDELSSVVLLMVALLSLCIFRYSIRYLDGDKNRYVFYRNFQFTVFAAVLFTLANNLLMFFAAWLATSYGLHALLLHFSDRPQAVLAARKKWWVSRLGDFCLLVGIVLTYALFGTFNFTELFELAQKPEAVVGPGILGGFSVVGFLFVIGAMTKSAQFPFHFWLPETMETPTPVSALMHAGIINAGGYLIIRLSPILMHATLAHGVLTVVGGVTAVFGALVMMTQTDIKRALAYSTVSQLGFMMIQCGLGLYSLALFHIVAHGFYKAHAFLSTGSVLAEVKAPKRNLSNLGLLIAYLVSIGLVLGGLSWSSQSTVTTSSLLIYFGLLALAITQVIGSRKELSGALANDVFASLAYLGSGFGVYACFEIFGGEYLGRALPSRLDIDAIWITSILAVFILFTIGIYIAKRLQSLEDPFARKLWVFLWNGGYIPQLSTRLFR